MNGSERFCSGGASSTTVTGSAGAGAVVAEVASGPAGGPAPDEQAAVSAASAPAARTAPAPISVVPDAERAEQGEAPDVHHPPVGRRVGGPDRDALAADQG